MNHATGAAFPPRNHDHDVCLADALWRAKVRCAERGVRWTGLRELVFRHLAASHRPLSAYDLIESIARDGKRLAPVSVYRILDVLQSMGLVHRLESRNAFFACMTEHPSLARTITLLCDDCKQVSEIAAPEALSAIGKTSEATRFHPKRTVVEVTGICGDCQKAEKEGPRVDRQ